MVSENCAEVVATTRKLPTTRAYDGAVPDDAQRELFLIDGNSLVYRAFFALPETIATSKGQPTNAIFGFASMLVKILTEHGQQPTLVVWDAGMSGRKEVYPEYKAQRSTKPDLLSEQWPHLQPLVDAFGYTNVKVDGFEADDVIASLATKAREQDIDVMVVTGDRDLFQLIEPGVTGDGHLARDHRDQDLRPRRGDRPLRDRARAGARLHRPEGRHLGQHPRRPGHRREDRLPAAPGVRRPGGRAVEHRLDLRRQAQGEPDQPRRGRARVQAAGHRRARRWTWTSTSTSHSRASPTARACARCSGSSSCATRCGGWRRRWATRRRPRRASARRSELGGACPRGRARRAVLG